MRLRLCPPAKLNRFLHIVGRRADGYHLLQTAFELIDWCDELTIETRSDDRVVLIGGTAGVPPERDLVWRAARLLQTLRPEAGCTLHLRKDIPTGAGLGGGSSDAAAVLLGLNRLWNLRLELPRLLELGLQLGADVPVFLGQTPAYAEGVGERLQALPWVDRQYLVVHPGVELGTAAMFAAADLCRAMPALSLQDYLGGQQTRNVFEPVARRLSPEVERCFAWVGRYGQARLTGSGSAVYCELTDPTAASAALAALPEHWRGRVVRTLTNWFDKAEAEG